MARVVKKVKSVDGKRKFPLKLVIIISSIVVIIATAGIVLGVNWDNWFNKEEKTYDYFSDYSDYKCNYDDLSDIISKGDIENIFIFAYNGNEFNAKTPDDKDEADYSVVDTEIEKNVIELIEAVNSKNNEGDKSTVVAIYLINTALTGNEVFLSNESYGSLSTAPCLAYVFGESYSSTTKDDKETVVSGTSTTNSSGSNSLVTYLKVAKNYVNNLEK